MEEAPKLTAPDYIFVLGAGYNPGVTDEQDMLGGECYHRVLTAVALWRQFPRAKFVLSGGGTDYPERPIERLGQLMRKAAILNGVPATQIIMEPHSLNTRQHPIEALKLPGVTANEPIALVTSGWHMRRARREFDRYFLKVGCSPVLLQNEPVKFYSFMPNSDAMSRNTVFLQEWIGMGWYGIYAKYQSRYLAP